MQTKKDFVQDVWPEVYGSRQNRTVLRWPVTGVNSYKIKTKDGGDEKIPCFVVGKEQVRGIVPLAESGIKINDNKNINYARMVKYIGQEIAFVVIGIDLDNERFIASRKTALDRLSAHAWPTLKEGLVVEATARRIYDNSVIVEFDGIEAYLPIHELSYGWVEEIMDIVQPGDKFDVKIINLDVENEKVTVSLKELIPNPWPGATQRYEKGGVYQGKVTGVSRYGVFVSLEPGVNALCRPLKTDRFKVEKGDSVALVVTGIKLKGEEGQVSGNLFRMIRKTQAS